MHRSFWMNQQDPLDEQSKLVLAQIEALRACRCDRPVRSCCSRAESWKRVFQGKGLANIYLIDKNLFASRDSKSAAHCTAI